MTAPKEQSVRLVKQWLQSEIPSAQVSVTGEYLTVEGSVSAVERLLQTKYRTYGKEIQLYFC